MSRSTLSFRPLQHLLLAVAMAAGMLLPALGSAQALVAPGDIRLRSDVQLLADTGAIDLPVMTWPIPADDLRLALRDGKQPEDLSPALAAAWQRTMDIVSDPSRGSLPTVGAAGAGRPIQLRTFDDSPRTSGAIDATASYSFRDAIAQFRVELAAAPQDDQKVRLDQSYVSWGLGNWLVGVSAQDRWWGPGWDGSIILSNSARPIPALMLERRTAYPFQSRMLHWIGPWRASLLIGRLEQGRVGIQKPMYLAARVVAKPKRWMEFAVSRSMIFCGSGFPCSVGAWVDALLERQNNLNGNAAVNGSPRYHRVQQAGFDLRLSSPWQALPAALYAQMIGRDAQKGIPFKYMAIFGAEAWNARANGAVIRTHLEFADTACSFYRSVPLYGCSYNDGLYLSGIRYKGFPIGDSLDGDSQVISAGGQYTQPNGANWSVLFRTGRLDRGGVTDPYNTVTPIPQKLRNVDIGWSRTIANDSLKVSLGFERRQTPSLNLSDGNLRGSVRWTRTF